MCMKAMELGIRGFHDEYMNMGIRLGYEDDSI